MLLAENGIMLWASLAVAFQNATAFHKKGKEWIEMVMQAMVRISQISDFASKKEWLGNNFKLKIGG